MEQVFRTEYFDNVTDIQDFLASNLNGDDPLSSEPSSIPSYDHDLNFYLDDRLETQNVIHGLSPATKKIQKAHMDKKKYQNISNEVRLQLIDAILNKKEKIKHAAKRLGINYSSAKYIFQVYKKEGRKDKIIFKKKTGREEVLDHVQDHPLNGTVVASNVLSLQNYNTSKSEGDPSTFYNTNGMIPTGSSTLPVQKANSEPLEANAEIITEKDKMVNNNAPQDKANEQYNLPLAEQIMQVPEGSQTENQTLYQGSSSGQQIQANYQDPTAMPHSTSNGTCSQAPTNYMLPYQTYCSNNSPIPQIHMNQNMPLYTNNLLQPNQFSQQNLMLPQHFQVYPVNYPIHGQNQLQNLPVMQSPMFQPINNTSPFPMYTQIPPMHNQMAMPVMIYFVGNPGPPAQNTPADNK